MPRVRTRHAALAIATMVCGAPAGAAADTLVTVAGTGTAGSLGDNSMAAAAQLNGSRGLARLGDGSILVADTVNNRIRRTAPDGTSPRSPGSARPAAWATTARPRPLSSTARATWPSRPTASPISSPTPPTTASGGSTPPGPSRRPPVAALRASPAMAAATLANLNGPSGVAVTATGGLLIADTTNSRIRLVVASVINTVAGNATAASTGDGSPANLATINLPQDVSVATGGAYLIADTAGNRIRRVDAGGTISTAAGTGTACAATTSLCGDYGPAVLAQFNAPASVAANAADTGFLVADTTDNRVRRVSPNGTISTLVGSGTACALSTSLCGDAGPAGLASLNAPRGVLELPDGVTLVSDTGTNRIRARVPDSAAAGPAGPSGPAGPAGPRGRPAAPAPRRNRDERDHAPARGRLRLDQAHGPHCGDDEAADRRDQPGRRSPADLPLRQDRRDATRRVPPGRTQAALGRAPARRHLRGDPHGDRRRGDRGRSRAAPRAPSAAP